MDLSAPRAPPASRLLLLLVLGVSAAAGDVHNVGGDAGWTIIGGVNYTAWASSRTFRVGDTVRFVYNKQFHNVLEVSKPDFRSCSASPPPLATYTSGNDSVKLERRGHYFFICGVPGHCRAGQKVNIRIPKSPAASPAAASGSPPAPALAPPMPNGCSFLAGSAVEGCFMAAIAAVALGISQ